MALEVASGFFGFPTSSGVDQVVSGLSFPPLLVKVWGCGTITGTDTVEAHNRGFIGISDGTNYKSISWVDKDGDSGHSKGVYLVHCKQGCALNHYVTN